MNIIMKMDVLKRSKHLVAGLLRTQAFSTSPAANKKHVILEKLQQRQLIRVKGEEVSTFLQGLITNDMAHLQNPAVKSIYAMFLNKLGRVLYDTILYRTNEPGNFLIECDRSITNELIRHLKIYRVRRKIQIDALDQELCVWSIFTPGECSDGFDFNLKENNNDITVTKDPRLRNLGSRILATDDKNFKNLSEILSSHSESLLISPNTNDNHYLLHRYRLGVAEGVAEIKPGKSFPLEANSDFLNGVSFHKGCYIGQELTARSYYTGVIRKRHMPIILTSPLEGGSEKKILTDKGANAGSLLESFHQNAIGLVRVELALNAGSVMIDGTPCQVQIPKWWPNELPYKIPARA